VRYGISDGDPYAPGLTCGGSLDVVASQVSAETFPGLDGVAWDVQAGTPWPRQTHRERLERLRDAGLTETELSGCRVRSASIWEPGHRRRPP
jgi:xanthine/CO dehydrogenase XdhC/CoxF family maturation factor